MSMLNAIMGCSRSIYQTAEDGTLPRWFTHLNVNGVPDRAMGFTAFCSICIVMFGSPLRIYIFSNVGYLFAIALVFYAYFLHRQGNPDIHRPVRLPSGMRWLALGLAIFLSVMWAYGGWNSPSIVVGAKDPSLFLLGLAAIGLYIPMNMWRRFSDRRLLARGVLDLTDLPVPAGGLQAELDAPVDTPVV
jgi:amino acid transporter